MARFNELSVVATSICQVNGNTKMSGYVGMLGTLLPSWTKFSSGSFEVPEVEIPTGQRSRPLPNRTSPRAHELSSPEARVTGRRWPLLHRSASDFALLAFLSHDTFGMTFSLFAACRRSARASDSLKIRSTNSPLPIRSSDDSVLLDSWHATLRFGIP
jgi:hypothetical protein